MLSEELLEEAKTRKKYMADYYQEHKAKKKKYSQDYYLEHKKEIDQKHKEYYEKHKQGKTVKIYLRQKDILKVLSSQRKNIGDNTYHLLLNEIGKLNKESFRT